MAKKKKKKYKRRTTSKPIEQTTPTPAADTTKLKEVLKEAVEDSSGAGTPLALGFACRYGGPDVVQVLLQAGASFAPQRGVQPLETYTVVEGDDPLSLAIAPYLWFLDTDLSYPNFGENLLIETDKRAPRLGKGQQKQVVRTLMQTKYESGFDPYKLVFLAALYGDANVLKMMEGINLDSHDGDLSFWLAIRGWYTRAAKKSDDIFSVAIVEALHRSDDPAALLQRLNKALEAEHLLVRPADIKQAIALGYIPELRDDLMLPLLKYTGYRYKVKRNEILEWSVQHNRADVLQLLLKKGFGARTWPAFDKFLQWAKNNGGGQDVMVLLEQALKDSGLKPRKPREKMSPVEAIAYSWGYDMPNAEEAYITSFRGRTADDSIVTVPDKIAKRSVTGIRADAFSPFDGRVLQESRDARARVQSLTIPGTVTTICRAMMAGHPGLRSLTLGEGVQEMRPGAFYRCPELAEVHLPSTLTHIEADAFRECTNLKTVTGLAPGAEVARGAFRGCPHLTDEHGMIRIDGRILGTDLDNVPGVLVIPEDEMEQYIPFLPELSPMTYVELKRGAVPPSAMDAKDVSAGKTVAFGRFPCDESLIPVPLLWTCVAREPDRALLITRDVITTVPDSWAKEKSPGDARVRTWMAEDFVQGAFTDEERARLLPTDRTDDGHMVRAFALSNAESDALPNETRHAAFSVYACAQRTPMPHESFDGVWVTQDLEFVHGLRSGLRPVTEKGPKTIRSREISNNAWLGTDTEGYPYDRRVEVRPAVWVSI